MDTEAQREGVLLINLGTPDAPEPAALRRYLAEFLADRRVVDIARWLWLPVLHGVILRLRPARSARLYQSIWTAQGSPLLVITRQQQEQLQQHLESTYPGRYRVVFGMRYGRPSIAAALQALHQEGIDRIVVLPLYPQNSCSTTASSLDALAAALRPVRAVPHLRFIADYHDAPEYISALAESVQAARQDPDQDAGHRPFLLFSFHGTPERFRQEGDPYYQQCLTTARLTAARLGLEDDAWQVSFQSRFGREPWLQPYTDKELAAMPARGIHNVQVICPGFAADCLETLEEIAVENRDIFLDAGGKTFDYIPALNDRPAHIDALAALVVANTCS